eukprot:scaffold17228_cov49-Cyclotella_meneghiniana.AAC.1
MYVGYYKGVQSFGAALSWIIEAKGTSYRTQLVICSCLAVLFIPPTYVVATCVQDKGGMRAAGAIEETVNADNRSRNVSGSQSRKSTSHTSRRSGTRGDASHSSRSTSMRSAAEIDRAIQKRAQRSSKRLVETPVMT